MHYIYIYIYIYIYVCVCVCVCVCVRTYVCISIFVTTRYDLSQPRNGWVCPSGVGSNIWLVGWLVSVLWHINLSRFLRPNPFYANSQFYFKQFSLA